MAKEARKSPKARAKPAKAHHPVVQRGEDAVAREAAISDILRVIASSPSDLQPVFDTILAHALRLCEGDVSRLWQYDGDKLRFAAHNNATAESVAYSLKHPLELGTYNPTPQAALERRVIHVLDVFANPNYRPLIPVGTSGKRPNAGTVLAVPLVRESELLGVITIWRYEKRPFSERQIELVKTFTAQAVIAIQNVRLFNETKQSLERQTATADILRVISGSPTSVQPVFEAILDNATRLCEAQLGALFLVQNDVWNMVSHRGASLEAPGFYRNFRAAPSTGLGRMARERRAVHIEDLLADAATSERDPLRMATIEKLGARTFLAVPLLKEARVLGAVVIYRQEVRPFGDAQIRLLSTFADQAVIAIENVRLFNETRDALERQTATSEILRVISSSPADLQPVFDTIVRNFVSLCGAVFGSVFTCDGELVHYAGGAGFTPERDRAHRAKYPVRVDDPSVVSARAIFTRAPVHIHDVLADPHYDPQRAATLGVRRILGVPMLRDGTPLGALVAGWAEPSATPKHQEDLLKIFADQAVIAIANVRLFNETKESLEQQTAIAEVLRVISSSPADVMPVLQAVAERAARICEAQYVDTLLVDGNVLRQAACIGEIGRPEGETRPLDRTTVMGRAVIDRVAVHVEDLLNAPADDFPLGRQLAAQLGHRTTLGVPLLREQHALGVILLRRTEVRPFTEKQIALLRTFADQAAIAIQNVRLFNETREALEQQKASAEVLGAISSSIADTRPVFDKIVQGCVRLFDGQQVGILVVREDGLAEVAAFHGEREAGKELTPVPVSHDSATGRAILSRQVMHYPDIVGGKDVPPLLLGNAQVFGIRSGLFAPMLWEGRGVGALYVGRETTGEFSEKAIRLLKTFADQAVIAIQNARLFREIQEKSAQLEVANKHKSDFLANMSHELRTPLNAIIGFSEALMERMFGEVNDKQADYLKDIHESGRHLLSLINDILDLSKIEAGRMELEVSTFDLPTALSNAMTLVRERAQRHDIELGLEVDQRLGEFQADERKFKQIMLNLLSNAVKFTPDGGRVEVCATKDTDKIEIAVKDTGIGIAPEDQAAVFEEFKQVGRDQMRKAEGTGLGLALTRRFVELHGGAIRLESTPGKGSTFTVSLPLRAG